MRAYRTVPWLLFCFLVISPNLAFLHAQEKPKASSNRQVYPLGEAPLELIPTSDTGLKENNATADSCGAKQLIKLGRGYNTLTGCFRGFSVDDSHTTDNNGGQTAEYSLEQIESFSDLRQYIGFSAAASFDAFAYGGSFSFSYIKQLELHRYSNFILAMVVVNNSTSGLSDFNLRPDALKIAKKVSPDNFLTRFGDTFVESTLTGGRFMALLEFVSESKAEQEAIRADLKGHYGKWDASASFEQSLSTLNKNLVTRIKVLREGGVGDIPDKEGLIKASLEFPRQVDPRAGGHPVIYAIGTEDYAATTNWPVGLKLPPILKTQKALIEQISEDRDKCLIFKSDIEYIQAHPDQFIKPDLPDLDQKLKAVNSEIRRTNDQGNSILEKPLQPVNYASVDFSKFRPIPDRRFDPTVPLKVRVFIGGLGWTDFSDGSWAGFPGRAGLIGLSVATRDKNPELGIEYDIRTVCWFAQPGGLVHNLHGADGEELIAPKTGADCWLNAFSFKLTGTNAKYYDIIYIGKFRNHGDSQVGRNGDLISIGVVGTPAGMDIVDAINVRVLAKPN